MEKLHLSSNDYKILGVCGGLAESFGISSDIVRLLFIISIFFGVTGLIAYAILYFILPRGYQDETIIDVKIDGEKQTRRLIRSLDNRLIAGICGGLAAFTGIDVSIFRILFVILTFTGGVGLLIYAILWIIIPDSIS